VTAPLTLTAKYAFIQNQPLYGFPEDRRELTLAASSQLRESWRVFGSATYDFETDVLVRSAAGFAYDDECFSYSMTLSETRDRITEDSSQSVGFNVSFRTIGDFGTNTSMFNTQ
jgi:LPS-assembly protein